MGLSLIYNPCLERITNRTLRGTKRINKHNFYKTQMTQISSGQSYKVSTFVIYDSRVVL